MILYPDCMNAKAKKHEQWQKRNKNKTGKTRTDFVQEYESNYEIEKHKLET